MYIFLFLIGLWIVFDFCRGYRKVKGKTGYLLKNISIFLGVVLLLFLFGPFFLLSPLKIGHSSLKSGGITLFYPSSQESRGYEIFDMAKKAGEDNLKFYGKTKNIKILVVFSELDMLRFGAPPKAGGAGTVFGILVRDSKASENVIAHEMSHKNLSELSNTKTSSKFPRWFDEGLASYIGKMDNYKTLQDLKEDLDKGLYRRDIAEWKGIGGILQWLNITFINPNPRLIYGQSYLMVKHLFDKYGQNKVQELVAKAAKSDFDKSFLSVFGISVDDFHADFIKSL
ncbi:MAG: hypothetical protein ABIH88_03475 [Patescibacteria group bacterium]|nr:hypothetical protein [Patescibacteria group bacterium]